MAQQGWLSFNEQVASKGSFGVLDEDSQEAVEALRHPMELRDTWVLWEQVVQDKDNAKDARYADTTRQVATFRTVQDFWKIWNGLPQPSELLENKRIMRESPSGPPVAIDAIMIFREGISPEWEHPANANGGHFQIQLKPTTGAGQIDEYWNNIVLAIIGGTIEHYELITGIRLVDKLGPRGANAVRMELWFTKYTEGNINILKKSMERHLATRLDGTQGTTPKPEMKVHASASKH